jgi:hypothetical protein
MDVAGGKFSAVSLGAVIGGEIDRDAALRQRDGERLGGEKMTTGAAGGEEDERRAAAGSAIGPPLRLIARRQAGLPSAGLP